MKAEEITTKIVRKSNLSEKIEIADVLMKEAQETIALQQARIEELEAENSALKNADREEEKAQAVLRAAVEWGEARNAFESITDGGGTRRFGDAILALEAAVKEWSE